MSEDKMKKIVHIHLAENDVFKSTLTAGQHNFVVDEPTSVPGGGDVGPDPYDLLLMSLGACTVMTVKMYARRKKWPLGDLFLELRHYKNHVEDCEACEDPNSKIDLIEKELIVKGDLTQEQRDRLLEISSRCPVHRTLLGEMRIDSTLAEK